MSEIPQHGMLLLHAESFINQGIFDVSIVVVHMSCEVVTERAFVAAFQANGMGHLEDPIFEFISGYNLANPRIRKLYTALSGDDIQQQPFWAEFKASADRRNAIVHQGKTATQAEAEASVSAGYSFVRHMRTKWGFA